MKWQFDSVAIIWISGISNLPLFGLLIVLRWFIRDGKCRRIIYTMKIYISIYDFRTKIVCFMVSRDLSINFGFKIGFRNRLIIGFVDFTRPNHLHLPICLLFVLAPIVFSSLDLERWTTKWPNFQRRNKIGFELMWLNVKNTLNRDKTKEREVKRPVNRKFVSFTIIFLKRKKL